MWTEIIPQLSGCFKDEAISPKTCFVQPPWRNMDMWTMSAVASVDRSGNDSDLGNGRTATGILEWCSAAQVTHQLEMATAREEEKCPPLSASTLLFYICLQFILTQLHQGRIRHEINWLHFTRVSYLLERLGVLEPCPPPPASSRPHLSGINSG